MDNLRKLEVAVKAGILVLKSGGEIYRVEDTILAICDGLGLKGSDCFVLPTGISASAVGDDGQPVTIVKRNKEISVDLERISLINELSRNVKEKQMSVEEVENSLVDIMNKPMFPVWINLLATAFIAGGFAIMFEGGLREAFWGFIFGPLVLSSRRITKVLNLGSFFQNAIGAAIAVIIASILYKYGLITLINPYIVGMLMILVPGLTITNAFRDTLRGDFISGLARTAEAIVVGVGIGFGAGLAFAAIRFI